MCPSSKVQTRLKPSLFSRQKQLLSLQVLKGISLVRTYALSGLSMGSKSGFHILGDIPGICRGYPRAAWATTTDRDVGDVHTNLFLV